MIFSSWLFWALAAAMAWGVGQVFSKKSLSQFSPLVYNLVSIPLGIIIILPFALGFGFNLGRFGLSDFLLLAFIATSYTLYYYVISLNKVSLSGTVLSTYWVYRDVWKRFAWRVGSWRRRAWLFLLASPIFWPKDSSIGWAWLTIFFLRLGLYSF